MYLQILANVIVLGFAMMTTYFNLNLRFSYQNLSSLNYGNCKYFQDLSGLSEAHEHDFPPLDESVHPSSMPDVSQLTESVVPGNSELYQK